MAKITALPTVAGLVGPERLPVVQHGETRGVSMVDLRDYFGEMLGGWHEGQQGIPGRDASELAQRVEFSTAAGNLVNDQTVFDLGFEYQAGLAHVVLNGLLLAPEDFSAPGGTTVMLARGVAASDVVTILPFLPANSLTPRLNVMMFGASGRDQLFDDDSRAFQRAFDFMAAIGTGELEVPAPKVGYRFLQGAVYRGMNPIRFIGSAPTAGRAIAGNDQATIIWHGPPDQACLTFETSGTSVAAALNGVEIENILLAVPVAQAKGSGGVGIAFRGVYGGIVRNLTVSGFDTGVLTDDNPTNAGTDPVTGLRNSVRTGKISFYDLRVLQAASFRVRMRATAQCAFFNASLLEESISGYTADLSIEPGTNGGRSDGNTFYGGALIGTDALADRPDYNVRLIDTIFNVFYGVAFERAKIAGCSVVANYFDYTVDAYAAAFVDCWWDAQAGFCVDSNRARTMVIDPRCGAHTGTGAAFRFVGDPSGATAPRIGGGVRGGIIGFGGEEGIQIISAAGVEVNGTEGLDARKGGRPLVRVEPSCVDTQLIGLRPGPNTVAYVDQGSNTLILGREIKSQRWIIDPTFYAQVQDGNPVLNFGPGSFIGFDRATNQFEFFVEGTRAATIGKTGITAVVRNP